MLRYLLVAVFALIPLGVLAETRLLMAQEPGCYWCAKWDEEISHIYPKTPEGKTAPLERFNLKGEVPDVEFARRVSFTPTFILVQNGKEVDRIEGYPGEDFFWGLLTMMFERWGISLSEAG
jgi:hypothetical protein